MKFNYNVYSKTTIREFLLSFYLSKSRVYTLFCDKKVLVNDQVVKENFIVNENDVVTIIEDEEIDFVLEDKPLDILYEDENFLIVNKPAGIIIHPDDKNKSNTLCNIVANYYQKMGYDLTVKYAHRLDYDTTGLIIFVKDMLTHAYMNQVISTHEVKRVYLALTENKFKVKKDVVNLPIGKDRHNPKRRRVSASGEEAITHYEVLDYNKGVSLVKLILETGRTHQIRVHMSYLNHILLGDVLYDGDDSLIKRCALHSYMVSFINPNNKKRITVKASLPSDMASLINEEVLKKL